MAFTNWRDTVVSLLSGVHWSQTTWGERLTGFIALVHDTASAGLGEARRAPWLLEDTSPDDALVYAGRDRNMQRYPYETNDQYRDRLMTAWTAWPLAGTPQALIDQFAALGITIEIYPHSEWTRSPVNHPVTDTLWWSKFTIFIRDGSAWGPPPNFGDTGVKFGAYGAVVGGGHLFGISGDHNLIAAARGIIRKWKAAHEVCREVVIADGAVFGDGSEFGDGTTFGGDSIVFSAT